MRRGRTWADLVNDTCSRAAFRRAWSKPRGRHEMDSAKHDSRPLRRAWHIRDPKGSRSTGEHTSRSDAGPCSPPASAQHLQSHQGRGTDQENDVSSNVATIPLNDGTTIPQLGLGVFQMTEDEAEAAVLCAHDEGYVLIDCAAGYENERAVGKAVAQHDRKDFYLTTKLKNDDQGFDETLRAFDASMDKLGVDTLDLYLIHWPSPARDKYVDSWRALIRLRDEGRVTSIGVSNFEPHHLKRIIAATGVQNSGHGEIIHAIGTGRRPRCSRRAGMYRRRSTARGATDRIVKACRAHRLQRPTSQHCSQVALHPHRSSCAKTVAKQQTWLTTARPMSRVLDSGRPQWQMDETHVIGPDWSGDSCHFR